MTTGSITYIYNTGNPSGSTDVRDGVDDIKFMDELCTSSDDYINNRLGGIRATAAGMTNSLLAKEQAFDSQLAAQEVEHNNQISVHELEHDNQIAAHELEHDNQIAAHESEFISQLQAQGWNPVAGSFETGGTIVNRRDIMWWEAAKSWYSWQGTIPLGGYVVASGSTPATSGGVSPTAWVDRTDGALRTELREKSTILDAREFGLSASGINSTGTLLSAINECNSIGHTLGISCDLDFGDSEIIVSSCLCSMSGRGWLKNLRFVINQSGDIFESFNGVGFSSSLEGGEHGIVIKAGRHLDFVGLRGKLLRSLIKGETDSTTGFHSIGLINIDRASCLNTGHVVELLHNSADEYAYNDFKITNSRGWFLRNGGVYAEQLDGLIYANNLMHSGRNTAAHKNHLYIKNGNWINIGGANTYFEAGKEAVLLEEVGTVSISGSNQIAFCGQQVISSGVKINNATSAFLNLSISDKAISCEKPSGGILDVSAVSGSSSIGLVRGNIDLRVGDAGSSQTYFGSTLLSSVSHYGVNLSGSSSIRGGESSGVFINSGGASSKLLDNDSSTVKTVQKYRLGNRSAIVDYEMTTTIPTGVATSLIGPNGYDNAGTNLASGSLITVQVYNQSQTKIGVYSLLYSRIGTSANIATVGAIHDANIVADTPAFTWQLSASGSIQVFPKALSAGGGTAGGVPFTFLFTAIGNTTFTNK